MHANDVEAGTAVAQRPLVGAKPVIALLRSAGLHVGHFAGPEDRQNVSTVGTLPLSGSSMASLLPA